MKIQIGQVFFLILPLFFSLENAIAQNSWDYKYTAPAISKNKFPKFRCTIDTVVYSNETIKGNIVFMNFWKSSCPPCVTEIAALNKLYNKLKKEKNFIFISFTSDDPEIIEMLIDKYNIQFPVLSMSDKYIKTIKFARGYPTNLILNEVGEVIYRRLGGSTFKKEADKIILEEMFHN